LRRKIARRASVGATPYRIGKDLGLDPHTIRKYAADLPLG
jgi:DNA-binding CsgD family transcriptional regulator